MYNFDENITPIPSPKNASTKTEVSSPDLKKREWATLTRPDFIFCLIKS